MHENCWRKSQGDKEAVIQKRGEGNQVYQGLRNLSFAMTTPH